MKPDKILAVLNREIRCLSETYSRKPALFKPQDFKDQIARVTAWAEAAAKDGGDTDFIEFTQFHLNHTRK